MLGRDGRDGLGCVLLLAPCCCLFLLCGLSCGGESECPDRRNGSAPNFACWGPSLFENLFSLTSKTNFSTTA